MNYFPETYDTFLGKISEPIVFFCKNFIKRAEEHINTKKLRKPRGSRGATSPGVADERVRPSSPLKSYILALNFSMNKPLKPSSKTKKCISLARALGHLPLCPLLISSLLLSLPLFAWPGE
ncbi:hypothetical protein N186_09520 [Thermofilum adornatum]|uniref:Uncharacterized protein n=1 Tax=Thermofilum adornatum TaxID=1365176 RepID=S5ZXV7_9CREN|nr:hypothetical protein N186_09520 [Thermofilum adornatum]